MGHAHGRVTPDGGLTSSAKAFVAGVVIAAFAAAVPALATLDVDARDWLTFAMLGAGAAVAQVLVIETGKNHGFPMAITFIVAGALLLPPALVALMALVQHAPDLARRRFPWRINAFNTCNHALNGLAAAVAARIVVDLDGASTSARWAAGALVACIAFVALNHLLLATMLMLARGHSFRAGGLFSRESVSIDLVLAVLGVTLVALAGSNPALVAAAVAPLLLVHRLFGLMAGVAGLRLPAH